MSPASTAAVKKTTRARKTTSVAEPTSADTTSSMQKVKPLENAFVILISTITEAQEEYEMLQKQIKQTQETWEEDQRQRVIKMQERDEQEDLMRKREKETYEYDIKLARKKDEDEFLERKAKWERDLQLRKDEIDKEKQELADLREQVAGFETQLAKAVKEATEALRKYLNDSFVTETKLREQEIKSEKELLALKITNFTQENLRQAQEIATLKKSLENATAQLKDVAVKVIESSGNKPQAIGSQEQ
jgi:chromosome segregation ATPase